jgi:hypothetical protein
MPEITIGDLDDYLKTLKHHDWYYSYSDDGGVWRRGDAAQKSIEAKAKTHEMYDKAYKIWVEYLNPSIDITGMQAIEKRDAAINALRDTLVGQ